ncbi:elongation factor 1b-related protein [Heterostelium album PN500]|uniref:Elongation factor 1b-related protein n=1 Tax=Heterostelium pallidum (strain ATCC 26659 / Pp 5 / PN500) TaxID=670386 RepID=D3BJR3_HETP5|nr:elongation factor 1b-related protein [Heterostelium album PN500]EFA78143.1 elongation factor 1b-related protein [Heterostelium album PN500]|eukprot:XP_020430269.1 elongation factor 1b-related protein [Heterostelium album PN500]
MKEKSAIVFDVRPEDESSDLKLVEQNIRKITKPGLCWGEAKCESLAYNLKHLMISCVVEDSVSVDDLQSQITNFPNVQTVEIESFSKI